MDSKWREDSMMQLPGRCDLWWREKLVSVTVEETLTHTHISSYSWSIFIYVLFTIALRCKQQRCSSAKDCKLIKYQRNQGIYLRYLNSSSAETQKTSTVPPQFKRISKSFSYPVNYLTLLIACHYGFREINDSDSHFTSSSTGLLDPAPPGEIWWRHST